MVHACSVGEEFDLAHNRLFGLATAYFHVLSSSEADVVCIVESIWTLNPYGHLPEKRLSRNIGNSIAGGFKLVHA